MDSMMYWAASRAGYWSDLGARMLPSMTAVFAAYRGCGSKPVVLKCAPEGYRGSRPVRARFSRRILRGDHPQSDRGSRVECRGATTVDG